MLVHLEAIYFSSEVRLYGTFTFPFKWVSNLHPRWACSRDSFEDILVVSTPDITTASRQMVSASFQTGRQYLNDESKNQSAFLTKVSVHRNKSGRKTRTGGFKLAVNIAE
jgi:hypothetical protein